MRVLYYYIRRFFLGCIAAQEKPGWAKFYTSPLPEAAAAQAREVERARDRLAQAKTAESQAVSDGSLDDCVAAREQEDAALEAIARRASTKSTSPSARMAPSACRTSLTSGTRPTRRRTRCPTTSSPCTTRPC